MAVASRTMPMAEIQLLIDVILLLSSVQHLPNAHPGAEPIAVINLAKPLLTDVRTPVNPSPDYPPLVVIFVYYCK